MGSSLLAFYQEANINEDWKGIIQKRGKFMEDMLQENPGSTS